MPTPVVDANYRFIAAYQEVNARVTQRQQALAMYVSIVISLLAAVVALRPAAGSADVPAEWLILGFPVASLCFAFLNHQAERAITNLRTFLSTLERLGDMHQQLPSYNTDPKWSHGANSARRFRDYAASLLVAGGNVVGLGAAQAIHAHRLSGAPAFFYVAVVLALASFTLVVRTAKWRYVPE